MSSYQPRARWVGPMLFCCLAVSTACSSSTDADSNVAGAPNGGQPSASGGSGGAANVAGSLAAGGSATGGTGGTAIEAGAGGTSSPGGAPAGGSSSGGSAGSNVGGRSAGGASGSAGSAAAGASTGGSGGGSSGGFTLTSPGWTAMAGCAADMTAACPVFPKDNIGTGIGGSNKSPELDWTAGPSGTQSYAIVLQDLTNITGGKPFVHWAMWNIPGATRMLPAGLETTAMPSVPAGSAQKSFSGNGYQGSGKCGNVYEFVLYALTTATYAGSTSSQTAVRDGLVATSAPTATLRAKSGAPGCTP
jgi:phosphatidylethanolamine-binding protein (PEBP) family uncharacterized protein